MNSSNDKIVVGKRIDFGAIVFNLIKNISRSLSSRNKVLLFSLSAVLSFPLALVASILWFTILERKYSFRTLAQTAPFAFIILIVITWFISKKFLVHTKPTISNLHWEHIQRFIVTLVILITVAYPTWMSIGSGIFNPPQNNHEIYVSPINDSTGEICILEIVNDEGIKINKENNNIYEVFSTGAWVSQIHGCQFFFPGSSTGSLKFNYIGPTDDVLTYRLRRNEDSGDFLVRVNGVKADVFNLYSEQADDTLRHLSLSRGASMIAWNLIGTAGLTAVILVLSMIILINHDRLLTWVPNKKFSYITIYLLIGVILQYIILWMLYPHEFFASDPWAYSLRAFSISKDISKFFNNLGSHPFEQRLGVTLPVAAFYKIFGVNLHSTNLWPLLAALIIIVVIYTALPTNKSKIIGLLLCASSITLFNQTVFLYSDIICTAFMALSSILLFYRRRAFSVKTLRYVYPILSIFFIFIAFLSKLSAYWIFPLWIYTVAVDLQSADKRAAKRFYLNALLAFMVLGLIYLTFSYLVRGHPLARFIGVQDLTGNHLWSWNNYESAHFIRRLAGGPVELLWNNYGIVLIFAFLAFWFIPRTYKFWVVYTLSTIFLFWFGSTSFTSYQPLPLRLRIVIPALPGIFILASIFLSIMTFSLPKYNYEKIIARLLLSICLIFSSIIPFVNFIKSWQEIKTPEENAIEIIRSTVLEKKNSDFLLICSDVRSPDSLAFFFEYEYPENLFAVYAKEITKEQVDAYDEAFIYVNQSRSKSLLNAYNSINYDEVMKSLKLPLIYEQGSILLFKTSDLDSFYANISDIQN